MEKIVAEVTDALENDSFTRIDHLLSVQHARTEPNVVSLPFSFHETDTHLKAQGAVLDLERQWNLAS